METPPDVQRDRPADDEYAKWSDREIAKHCGVSHTFVATMRSEEAAAKHKARREASAAKVATVATQGDEKVATVATQEVVQVATVATAPANDKQSRLSRWCRKWFRPSPSTPSSTPCTAKWSSSSRPWPLPTWAP